MKRPSFQFYPGDWLHDAALRMVSIGARGLWIDMICLMHQGSDYGYLKVNGKVILTPNLARMVGATLHEVEGWLHELLHAGVYSVDGDGCIFSRRMIRDEEVRKARADGGSKGGNPALMGKKKVAEKVNLDANLQPTPSSSSSSSSSDNPPSEDKRAKFAPPIPADVLADWMAVRKAKRAGPVTKIAWGGLEREALKARISPEDAVRIAIMRSWVSFNAAWDWRPTAKQLSVQEARLDTASQIFGGRNGTDGQIIDVEPSGSIEGDGAHLPEALPGLR